MTSLAELVLGLQRMAENVRMSGDDIRYIRQQEDNERIQWIDHQLAMVDKIRAAFLEERKRLMPVHQVTREETLRQIEEQNPIPKVVQQGPRKPV